MFVLNSDITIGGFRFRRVNDVLIKRSITSASDSCMIKMPSVGRIRKKDGTVTGQQTLSLLFKEGDKVSVALGYNGHMNTEFEGFVRQINPQKPLEIDCEGYVRPIRLNKSLKDFYAETSVKKLLELAVKGTDIALDVQADIPLYNITLDNAGGTDIITEIRRITQGVITIFFIEPKKLWCGLTYTAYKNGTDPFGIGLVKYRIGYNCKRDNALKIKTPSEPVQVIFQGTYATGRRITTESEKKVEGNKVTAINNNLRSTDWMKRIANEMQYHRNYTGFEGKISGLLAPFARPGYKIYLIDSRYPANTGYYLAEGVEVHYSPSGATRSIEVGPLLGFKS